MRRVLPRDFCIRSPSFQKKKRAKKEREFSRKQAPRHAHASPSKLSLEKGVHRDLSYYFIFSPLTFQPTSRAWARPRPSRWVSSVFKIGASPPSPPLRFRTTFANVRGEQFLFFFSKRFFNWGRVAFRKWKYNDDNARRVSMARGVVWKYEEKGEEEERWMMNNLVD